MGLGVRQHEVLARGALTPEPRAYSAGQPDCAVHGQGHTVVSTRHRRSTMDGRRSLILGWQVRPLH